MLASFRSASPAALGAALWLAAAIPAQAHAYTSGSDPDFEFALDAEPGAALWFTRDGKSYVVRDAALVAEAQRIVEPMAELGAQQGKLGRLQGRLGAKQGKLGAKQGLLGARLASLSVNAAWGDGESRTDRSERRRIEEEMAELGRRQASASKQATTDLRRLAERAIAAGKARPTKI